MNKTGLQTVSKTVKHQIFRETVFRKNGGVMADKCKVKVVNLGPRLHRQIDGQTQSHGQKMLWGGA